MNKNITIGIGFILVAIIAYQGYLLYQKGHPDAKLPSFTKEIKKDEPQINISVGSKNHQKTTRSNNTNIQAKATPNNNQITSNLTPKERMELDKQRIQHSLQDLIKSIFASKEVQDGLKEFKTQAEIGFKELQKELNELPKQLDNLSAQVGDDPFLSELFTGLKNIQASQFEDRGDYYYKELKLPDGKDSKVDISSDNGFLTITVSSKKSSTKTTKNGQISQSSSSNFKTIMALPNDALVEKIDTEYKDGVLQIKIPKVQVKGSV